MVILLHTVIRGVDVPERRQVMFKKLSSALILFFAFIALTAMGGGGGFERAPRVEKNFGVEVTDVSGTRIDGQNFSWEGRIHFIGFKGMAQVTVPFDKIREFSVTDKIERKVRVAAKLTDGTETVFDVDMKSRCYGEATFGSFTLQMDEIRSVVFKK
jgi:hypothetical protein